MVTIITKNRIRRIKGAFFTTWKFATFEKAHTFMVKYNLKDRIIDIF